MKTKSSLKLFLFSLIVLSACGDVHKHETVQQIQEANLKLYSVEELNAVLKQTPSEDNFDVRVLASISKFEKKDYFLMKIEGGFEMVHFDVLGALEAHSDDNVHKVGCHQDECKYEFVGGGYDLFVKKEKK